MKLNSPMSLTECCEGAMAFTRRSLAQATANKEKTFQYLFVEGLIGSDEYVCFDEHPSEECWTGWANTNMEIDGRHPIKMLIRSFEIPQKKEKSKSRSCGSELKNSQKGNDMFVVIITEEELNPEIESCESDLLSRHPYATLDAAKKAIDVSVKTIVAEACDMLTNASTEGELQEFEEECVSRTENLDGSCVTLEILHFAHAKRYTFRVREVEVSA